jgi:hypothetical protein
MKQKILYKWSLRRVLYLSLGILVIIYSLMERQWLGILLGGYFAAMGIFGFGCAGDTCSPGSRK